MNGKSLCRLAIGILVCGLCSVARAGDGLEKTDLFEAGKGGYALYRIPGIIATSKGTLLAYCEARKSAGGDWGTIDVVMRRSEDGGRSWDEARRIATAPADAQRNPAAVKQKLGKEGEITVNNPVAIADRSGAIHFLYCIEYGRCFTMRSDDDGQTFGKPVEITTAFEKFRPDYHWKVLATGPGHGIQLASGRLLVPVWLSTAEGGHAHRPSCVSTIYSDDDGRSWQRGQIVAAHPEPANPSETAAVELSDGRVMLNIRQEGPQRRRAVTTSLDGATAWSKLRYDDALPEPVCMASLVRLELDASGASLGAIGGLPATASKEQGASGSPSASAGKGGQAARATRLAILFSNPHNPDGRERKNLTLKASFDDGSTWPVARTIEPGTGGYSDLTVGPDGTIYCFYERGGLQGSAYKTNFLTVASFRLPWLTEDPKTP